MNETRSKKEPISAQVCAYVEVEVIQILDQLAAAEGLPRAYFIRRALRQFAFSVGDNSSDGMIPKTQSQSASA